MKPKRMHEKCSSLEEVRGVSKPFIIEVHCICFPLQKTHELVSLSVCTENNKIRKLLTVLSLFYLMRISSIIDLYIVSPQYDTTITKANETSSLAKLFSKSAKGSNSQLKIYAFHTARRCISFPCHPAGAQLSSTHDLD